MNQVHRYDVEAAKNVMTMLRAESPPDYAILMARLKSQAGMAGLGLAAEEESPGFWENLLTLGTGALTTIADYKIAEQTTKYQAEAQAKQYAYESTALQQQYDSAVATEMARQAANAAQAETLQQDMANRIALQNQTNELYAAAGRAKTKFNWAIAAAGALGVFLVWRLVA